MHASKFVSIKLELDDHRGGVRQQNWLRIFTSSEKISGGATGQGRALFDTGDSDVHQHELYQMRPHSTWSDEESLSYDPKTKCQTV